MSASAQPAPQVQIPPVAQPAAGGAQPATSIPPYAQAQAAQSAGHPSGQSSSPRAVISTQFQSHTADNESLFGIKVRENEDVRFGMDRKAIRGLQQLSLALLVFFTVVTAITLLREQSQHNDRAQQDLLRHIELSAESGGVALANQVAWTDTALGFDGNPARMVEVAVRGAGVAGAAIVTADGRVLASRPFESGEYLSSAVSSSASASGVEITSVVAQDGTTNPVVVRDSSVGKLVVAFAPGILAQPSEGTTVVVSPTGRLIDAPKDVALKGVLSAFSMSDKGLALMTQGRDEREVSRHSIAGESVWLAAERIPNSDLTLLKAVERSNSPRLIPQLLIFLSLFGGTCAVILAMMQRVLRHMQKAQNTFEADEVARQRYQAAIDGTGGGIFEIDLSTEAVFLSKALVEVLNLGSAERVLPLPQFLSLFHDDSREQLYHSVRRAHMSGEFECELQVRHLPVWLNCRAQPIMRSDGTNEIPTRKIIVGMAHDVTEKRGAQLRLRLAEGRLFDALRSMSDAFVIWDQRDRLVLWNSRFEDFFGFQPGNLKVGLDHSTVEYHANASVLSSSPLDGIDGGSEIQLSDGRWIRYLESPTQDGGRVSIGTEITEIRTREGELRKNHVALQSNLEALKETQLRLVNLAQNYEVEKIRAEEANQSKSEFLANMSHELRTPLNAINGFSDIMQKEMFGPLGDPRYKEYVNDILFSGKHLLSLINDILDMSKIEAGKMTLNVDTLMVNDMINQVIRIVRGRAEENRLKLVYRQTETQAIEADPRAVKQILLNMITNAIKFTPEGGVVRVDCEAKSAGVIVRISDSGMGISKEDLIRLAQPFEQASNNTSGEGTGLGLALSKSLVELHGGNFHIASKLGEGTTITFTLPNRPVPISKDAEEPGVSEEINRIATTISAALQQGVEASQRGPGAAQPADGSAIPMPGPVQTPVPGAAPAQPAGHLPQPYVPPAA